MSDTFSSDLERAEKQELQPRDVASLDPFGSEDGAAIHYKTCSWWHIGALMVAETISLGVLGLPHAVAMLGLVPGILLIVFLGLYATYTGYVVGQFRNKHPAVANWADAAGIVGGPWAYEIIGFASILLIVFIMAAHILSFSIMMNVLTDHATCSIAFAVMGLVVCFIGGLPRTWKNVSYTSIVCESPTHHPISSAELLTPSKLVYQSSSPSASLSSALLSPSFRMLVTSISSTTKAASRPRSWPS